MKKGFTLIELLAVIIILAIVALISTPIILNVVDEARESANKSSVAMYADVVKLAVIDEYFENQSYPIIDKNWALANVEYGGEKITCEAIYYTENEGVTLHECIIGDVSFNYVDDMSVSAENTVYCYTKGKVYTDCTDAEYVTYHEAAKAGVSSTHAGYVDASGANAPQLSSGMTPIKWVDGVETETTQYDDEWYDYGNKEWANAKTEDGSYWVWVPRYAYKILSGYHTNVAGEIDIKFLTGNTNTPIDTTVIETADYEVGVKDTSMHYFVHPAFQGNSELGFWMAKFEASVADQTDACYINVNETDCDKTTLVPKIIPDAMNWREISIGNAFDVMINMKDNAIYGWNSSKVDTHMMKNMEWGAVAYLSQSKYGRCIDGVCTEISKNDSLLGYTGRSSGADGAGTTGYPSNGTYTYKTVEGQKASTTGNIYGIYDMSGGRQEYVAAILPNGSSHIGNYAESLNNAANQYKDIYIVGSTTVANDIYEINKNVYGDAIYETSSSGEGENSWNADHSSYFYSSYSFVSRGGLCVYTTKNGIFDFRPMLGNPSADYGFRPVLSVIN